MFLGLERLQILRRLRIADGFHSDPKSLSFLTYRTPLVLILDGRNVVD